MPIASTTPSAAAWLARPTEPETATLLDLLHRQTERFDATGRRPLGTGRRRPGQAAPACPPA